MGVDHVALIGGTDASGAALALRIDRSTGLVVERGADVSTDGADRADCAGHVLLPAPAEPHAHLDKAFTADRVHNAAGDLAGAVAAFAKAWPSMEVADVVRRASLGVREAVRAGCTAIRTHVDLSAAVGMKSVHALVEVRERVHAIDLAELQIAALVQPPVTGADGGAQRLLLEEALDAGIDVIGGVPSRESDPVAFIDLVLELADSHGVRVDLHVDETLEDVHTLDRLLDAVERHRPAGDVTASHCVSLGMVDLGRQRETAARVAELGVGIVTLPATNLFLQGRDRSMATPRGLTAIGPLLEAGALVCAGADNVRDPFNWLGAHDPVLVSQLLVSAGHTSVEQAWQMVSSTAHAVLGRGASTLEVGERGDVLAVQAATARDAIATATDGRLVFRGGSLVSSVLVGEPEGLIRDLTT